MATVIQRAQRVGRKAHTAINAVLVQYVLNGESVPITLAATPGFRRTEETLSSGVVIDRQLVDFICELSALPRLPKRGDKIYYDSRVFTVQHPGGGREYDWHDQYNESLRIHTVETASTAPPVGAVLQGYAAAKGSPYGTFTGQRYSRP